MEKRVLPEASSKSFLSLGRGDELGLGGWRFTLKTMLPDSSANARIPRETPACFLEPNRSIGISQFPDPGYDDSEVPNSIFPWLCAILYQQPTSNCKNLLKNK